MRKLIGLFILSLFVVSCSSDDDQTLVPKETTFGKQVFSIDSKDLSSKNPSNNNGKSLDPAFALISIEDNDGNVIHERTKFSLTKVDEKYVTEEITMPSGSYNLTEFIVTDADNMVISLVPKVDSILSELTESALPIGLTVETDKINITSTDNIEAADFAPVHFGYTGLNLVFPTSDDFFSLTIDDSILVAPKNIVLKSYGASTYTVDWGDGTIEDYVSTGVNSVDENVLTHTYDQANMYNVKISGPVALIDEFKFYSNDVEGGWPVQSNIVSANVDKLILLKKCEIYFGSLSTLDTSKNIVLETLSLGYNQLTSLDFTSNKNLESVWLRYNQLTEMNVSQNPNMDFLWVDGNQISALDLSNNSKLRVVLARENNLGSIDFSNNLELEVFDLADNELTAIDISSNLALKEINVGVNSLNSIDLSQNTKLVRIDLYENQFTNIDLSLLLDLRDIYINGNLLTGLDLANNPKLERLIIENNSFSSLDLTNNPKIFDLEMRGNQFSSTELDQIIAQVHEQAVLNSIRNGYLDFGNNPGYDQINSGTTDKINELVGTYNWFFNDY